MSGSLVKPEAEGTPTSPPQPTKVPYYIKALAMALPAIMLGFQISGWIFFSASIRDGHPDFRANYTAGYLVRTGKSDYLYDYDEIKRVQDANISREYVGMPFIHPAYEALFFVPFSFLGFHGGYFAFLATNLVLLTLSLRILRSRLEDLARIWKPLPAAVLFTFLPVAAALLQEQDSILLLTLLTLAFVALDNSNEFNAGFLAGIGLFRLQLVIPIAAAFLLWRRWRFIAGFASSSSIVLAISVWLAGVSQTRTYLGQLATMSVGGNSQLDKLRYAQPITHMGNLRAFVFGITSTWLSPVSVQGLTIVLSIGVMLWLLVLPRRAKASHRLLVAITASVIVSYHCFIHDMSILVLPVAICLREVLASWESGSPDKRFALASAIMFTAPALIVFAPFHFYLILLAESAFLFVLMRSMATSDYVAPDRISH